jgi:uncharacterized delta-60 repeat protein
MSAQGFGFGFIKVSQTHWIATLGGTLADLGQAIALDSSANVYVTGYTASGAGRNDIFIAKYDASGIIQWQKTLGGTGDERGFGISVDSSGNVYVAGDTDSSGAGNTDIFITKYDTSGAIQWQKTLGDTSSETGQAIALDSSGNVYVTGGSNDVIVTKYDTSGAIQWQRSLGSSNTDYGFGISLDSSANVYITGYTASSGAGSNDVLIAKYDTSGAIQWQRTLGGTNNDQGFSISIDNSGNVYVAGQTSSSGAVVQDVLITKYNTSGTIQWQRTLGGAAADFGRGIALDNSGNVYIVGQTSSSGAGSIDVIITKYNNSGSIQFQRTLGGASADQGYGISVDNLGNMYIVGITYSSGAGNADFLIAKLPTDGSLTGTYGSFTYAASSLTAATSTLIASTSTLTNSTSTLTSSTSTLTSTTSSFTSTVIQI